MEGTPNIMKLYTSNPLKKRQNLGWYSIVCMDRKMCDYIKVKSPDSNIFFILLHYACQLEKATVLFDTGSGNVQRLINITEIAKTFTPKHCTALLTLHAYSGWDSTSAFKGIGKVKPIKTLQLMPNFIPVFSSLGDTWEISDDLIKDLEKFTCAMYGRSRFTSVDELRYFLNKEKCTTGDSLNPSKIWTWDHFLQVKCAWFSI